MAIELGAAYVTVIPQMKGAQAAIGNALGDSKIGAQAGQKVGGGFLDSFGGKLKAAGAAIAGSAAVKAVYSFGKAAVSAYADYEQLYGGVEKLFGADNAAKINDLASSAYKTSQISANDYLDQVTKFSASLIESLGGDTDKAVSYADMAISDMSDNASVFGTDIESIQMAYQGFAKNNYTMLDNLRLGYSGSQEGMQQLLAKAEEISGKHFELGNFADMTEAIHIVQTEMGITGNAADEMEHTISGSLASLQAQWGNWLVAVTSGSGDIKAETAALAKSFITAVSNIVPAIGQILLSLIELIPGMSDLKDWAVNTFGAEFTAMFNSISDFVMNSFVPSVTAYIEMLMPVFQFVGSVLGAVLQTLVGVLSFVVQSFSSAASIITSAMRTVYSVLTPIVNGIASLFSGVFNGIYSTVSGVFNGIKNFITDTMNGIKNTIRSALDTVSNFFSGLKLELPRFAVPHFNIRGEFPWGIGGGTPPSISVDWYATGGIVDGATLIGAGEKGGELIWPSYEPYLSKYADAIAGRMDNFGTIKAAIESALSGTDRVISINVSDREVARVVRTYA